MKRSSAANPAHLWAGEAQILPKEADEQIALLKWCDWNGFTNYFAIPNGGTRHVREAMKLKRGGVKPGVPDIFFHVVRGEYGGLFLEMKRIKGGKVSVEQAAMMERLTSCGYKCAVAYGFEEGKNIVVEYMRLGRESSNE